MAFIDGHRERETGGLVWGVEPICRVLQFAPSTYYDVRSRPASRRSVSDAGLREEIARVHRENPDCYGAEKVWRELHREGIAITPLTSSAAHANGRTPNHPAARHTTGTRSPPDTKSCSEPPWSHRRL